MSLLDFCWDHRYEIVSLAATCLVTLGVSFLFYPAYLVYHHGEIKHSIKILGPPTTTSKENDDSTSSTTTTPNIVLLSLVIPAYNEEDRLTVMLDECYEYFCRPKCESLENLIKADQKSSSPTANTSGTVAVEWIVVNDGSSDSTCQVFEQFVSSREKQQQQQSTNTSSTPQFLFKLVTLPINEGKGAAVQVGMTEAATGQYRLMVDADAATTFGIGLEAVTKAIIAKESNNEDKSGAAAAAAALPVIVFGSRAGDGGAKRTALRSFLMHSFLWLRSVVVGTPVSLRDTQCGFKLFDKPSALQLFSNLHLRRWAFDIELVYVALSTGIEIQEVTVPWHEVDGSKLNTGFFALMWASVGMLRDMMCVRVCYVLGIWKINR